MNPSGRVFFVLPHLDVPPFEERRQERIVRERRLVLLSRQAGHAAELFVLSRSTVPRRLDDEVGTWLAPSSTPASQDRFGHCSPFVLNEIERLRPDLVVVKGCGYRMTSWLLLNSRHRFRLAMLPAGGTQDAATPWADFVLAETDSQLEHAFAGLLDQGRAAILPKYIDTGGVPRPDSPMFDVVNIGRFTPNKNQVALLPLADTHRLALVGDGTCWHAVNHEAQACMHPVAMPGNLPHADALAVLAASRLMVHSAHHEGLARVVMEALSLGVPVVASAHAMPGAFEHGVQGLLVAPDRLVESARALLADEPRRIEMGRAARSYAEQRCGDAALMAALDTMFKRVMPAPAVFTPGLCSRVRLWARGAAQRAPSALRRWSGTAALRKLVRSVVSGRAHGPRPS